MLYDNAGILGNLATGNNGVLVTSSGGVPSISSTLPAATQANITGTGTLTSGATGAGFTVALSTSTVTGALPLANGGTNNTGLAASNGGVVYSDASKLQMLAGTVTASQCLLSGSNAAPTWGSCSGAAAVSSVADSGTGTLTISPTTGSVVAAINLGNANTWTAAQTFTNSDIKLLGSSTGATTFTSANASSSNYTLTLPAITSTVAVLGLAQTWTAAQTFNNATLKLAGSSSGTSIIEAPATGGGTATLPAGSGTLFYPASNASFSGTPSNPTGTTSSTAKMMGLGSTCTITPATTGRVQFNIIGTAENSTSGKVTAVQVYYGTGTAPTNGAAATGTPIGNGVGSSVNLANYQTPFNVGELITGLSPGTAYWFDAGVNAANASGTATIINTTCEAAES